jgi:hypothetical protein
MKGYSQKGTTVPPSALFNAVNSLYDDELKPNLGLLRRRLKELYDVYLPAQDVREIVQVFVDAKIMRADGDAGDLVVMLTSRPSGCLVDPMDPDEPYDPEIFQRLQAIMDAVAAADPHRLYKGGRYGMAQQLRSVEMPELKRFSLGWVCHIVQRAIERKIVGYKKGGSLAPYRLSDAFLKNAAENHDLLQADLPTIKTMAELRAVLTMLWMNPKHHQGLSLSQVKDEIKRSAKRSLSEQLLGYGKLSQLFTAPELAGSCDMFYECHDVLLCPPILVSANEVFTQRTRTDCTPASSRFSLAAPRREGSSDLSHECRDVSQYPPTPVNAKEVCTTASSRGSLTAPRREGSSDLSLDEDRSLVYAMNLDCPRQVARERTLYPPSLVNAKGDCTDRTGCTPIPSRRSFTKDPTPAAIEASSATVSPALTFASEVSDVSSAPTADGSADGLAGVPPPLLLPDLFNVPPPLLPNVPFVNALCLDTPEMLRWGGMVPAALQLTLALAAVQRESMT